MNFGPKNQEEAVIFEIEALRANVQYDILRALKESGLSQAQLARKMGVSAAWVSQLLSDEANLTVESIAKVYFALGRECAFSSNRDARQKKVAGEAKAAPGEQKAAFDASVWTADFALWMVEEPQSERPAVPARRESSTAHLLMKVIASQTTSIRAVETCNDNGAYVSAQFKEIA